MTTITLAVLSAVALTARWRGAGSVRDDVPPTPARRVLPGLVVIALAQVLGSPVLSSLALHIGTALVLLQFRAVPGMRLVLAGVLANGLVILLNGAMPVLPGAVEFLGGSTEVATDSARHELATGATRLTILGDVIPIPGARAIVSVGDLAMLGGTAILLDAALQRAFRRRDRTASKAPSHFTAAPARVVTVATGDVTGSRSPWGR